MLELQHWRNFVSEVGRLGRNQLIVTTAEFRDSIPAAMPQVVDSLKDNNGTDIRVMAANNIARLSEQCESSVRSAVPLLKCITAEFCQSIQTSIPQIVKFLNDKDSYVRWVGVDVLAKLSAQGDRCAVRCAAVLNGYCSRASRGHFGLHP